MVYFPGVESLVTKAPCPMHASPIFTSPRLSHSNQDIKEDIEMRVNLVDKTNYCNSGVEDQMC